MVMYRIQTAVVNSPLHRGLQRFTRRGSAQLGIRVAGGRAVEVGCGSGEATRLILDKFGATQVDAFDLDPAMVERARRWLAGYGTGTSRPMPLPKISPLARPATRRDAVHSG